MNKKFFSAAAALFFLFISVQSLYSADWILAAEKFSFTRSGSRTSSEEANASLLPSLILEQISDSSFRMTSDEEMLNRKLKELLTERQSLFLQLSKESQTRDTLFLSETSQRSLKKKIAAQEKKISELKEKISENLEKASKAQKEVEERIKKMNMSEGELVRKIDFSIKAINSFFKRSREKKENYVEFPQKENVALYKNDVSSLFSADDEVKSYGYDSAVFEKAVLAEKINALLTGKMTVYGEYVQVSVLLYIYPGHSILASVTEIGTLNDLPSIARNIASSIMPKISNNREIELYIKIEPEEIRENVVLAVDGVVQKNFGEKIVVDGGRHILEFSCQGYPSKNITFDFFAAPAFLVTVPFEEEKNIVFDLNFLTPDELDVFSFATYDATLSKETMAVPLKTTAGLNVLGQAVQKEKFETVRKAKLDKDGKELLDKDGNVIYEEVQEPLPSKSFFFYIPYETAQKNQVLAVKARSTDIASEIDKRRIWTYRAYTALVISLPFMLYTTGRYNSAVRAYNSSYLDDISTIQAWGNMKDISTIVTLGCAGFFAIELVRYLLTANKVLPYEAGRVSEKTLLKTQKKYDAFFALSDAEDDGLAGDTAESGETETAAEGVGSESQEEAEAGIGEKEAGIGEKETGAGAKSASENETGAPDSGRSAENTKNSSGKGE